MSENQLHNLYTFLTEKFSGIDARFDAVDKRFDGIDRRFDAVDARFDENELIQNEILNAIGNEMNSINQLLKNHEKRITKLEKHLI